MYHLLKVHSQVWMYLALELAMQAMHTSLKQEPSPNWSLLCTQRVRYNDIVVKLAWAGVLEFLSCPAT